MCLLKWQAKEHFDKAISLSKKKYLFPYRNRGICHIYCGEYDSGLIDVEESISISTKLFNHNHFLKHLLLKCQITYGQIWKQIYCVTLDTLDGILFSDVIKIIVDYLFTDDCVIYGDMRCHELWVLGDLPPSLM